MGAYHSLKANRIHVSTRGSSFSFKSSRTILPSKHNSSSSRLRQNDELIVKIMMPLYYVEEAIIFPELYEARKVWDMILDNASPQFEKMKTELPYRNCREWFEKAFYERLFNVHPFSKTMFKDPDVQGKFMVSLLSFVFTILDNEETFKGRLSQLAESHARRGVKSSEYAIIGEVMFWTLKNCLGSAYTAKAHNGWVKIFSSMLKVIVPISVAIELKDSTLQKERVEIYNNSNSVTPKLAKSNSSKIDETCPFTYESTSDQYTIAHDYPRVKVMNIKSI